MRTVYHCKIDYRPLKIRHVGTQNLPKFSNVLTFISLQYRNDISYIMHNQFARYLGNAK